MHLLLCNSFSACQCTHVKQAYGVFGAQLLQCHGNNWMIGCFWIVHDEANPHVLTPCLKDIRIRAKVLLIRSQLKCLIGISCSMESYNMHYNTSETDREVSVSQILTIDSSVFRTAPDLINTY